MDLRRPRLLSHPIRGRASRVYRYRRPGPAGACFVSRRAAGRPSWVVIVGRGPLGSPLPAEPPNQGAGIAGLPISATGAGGCLFRFTSGSWVSPVPPSPAALAATRTPPAHSQLSAAHCRHRCPGQVAVPAHRAAGCTGGTACRRYHRRQPHWPRREPHQPTRSYLQHIAATGAPLGWTAKPASAAAPVATAA